MNDVRRRLCALSPLFSLVVCVFFTSAALANGRFPATSSITLRPDRDDHIIIGTTFGAVISKDSGAHWSWICEQSIGYGGTIDPTFVWTPNDRIYAVTFFGLAISSDEGCTWKTQSFFDDRGASDIVVHPTTPTTLFVTTDRNGSTNGLYRSDDAGDTFRATGLERTDIHFASVRISPSNPLRIYVSGTRDMPYQAYIMRSDDGGDTWMDLPQQVPQFSVLYLLAVSPLDPNVLFVYLAGTPDLVLRSDDDGQNFMELFTPAEPVRNATISDDGNTVWISTTGRIYRSKDGGKNFADLPSPQKNACVMRHGNTLFACGWPWADGYAAARSNNGGDTWQTIYDLSDVDGVLQCPVGSPTHDMCEPRWPQLVATLNLSDGGADGGTQPTPPKGCGCAAGGKSAAPGAVPLLAFGILLAARIRRRRA
jgi:MYXO-CTERM domain-containing protein